MKKRFYEFIVILILACCMFLISCGGSGNNQASESTSNDLAKYMTIAQQEIEKYYDNMSYSYKDDDWTIFYDANNSTTSISTKVSRKSDSGKKVLNVIITLSESKNKYTSHFVEYGGEILFDDGTIE